MEGEYRTLFERTGYGSTMWSPLAGGFLTGKYLDGIPEETNRLTDKDKFPADLYKKIFYDPFSNENCVKGLKEVKKIAEEELNCKLNHLALAWAMKFKYTSTIIVGSRNVEQLEDNLKAFEVMEKLTPELEGKINKLLGNGPDNRMYFTVGKPDVPVRPIAQ